MKTKETQLFGHSWSERVFKGENLLLFAISRFGRREHKYIFLCSWLARKSLVHARHTIKPGLSGFTSEDNKVIKAKIHPKMKVLTS